MPASAAPSSDRFAHFTALGLTVLVFGVAVAVVTLQLRAGLREQSLRREAEWLEAIAAMQIAGAAEDLGSEPIENVPGALFVALLKTTRKLAGVSGIRLYDARGKPSDAWILPRSEEPVPEDVMKRLGGGAFGRLHPRLTSDETAEFLLASPTDTMVEAWVPLRRSGSDALIGAAQIWRDGRSLGADLAKHDQRLWMQAAIAWLAGSFVIALALGWALRRIESVNRELRARGEDLQRANRELVLAAKTSALGAVTAHLMHEIKNPLAGLEVLVAGQMEIGGRSETGSGGELAAASELTRRLRTMVNDVVGVLRDEQTGADFELTCADIVELAAAKVQSDAEARGVKIEAQGISTVSFSGRRANLATLVLRNLLQNALEATPSGGLVKVHANGNGAGADFVVADGGSGLPPAVRSRLFQPCSSSKVGGSGLGLALSYQLAHQAGGRLELVRSDASGTSFRLVLGPEA